MVLPALNDAIVRVLEFFGLRRTGPLDDPEAVSAEPTRTNKRYKLYRGDEILVLDDSDSDKEEAAPPVKRSKYTDIPIAVENSFRRRNSWTQTVDLTDDADEKEFVSPRWKRPQTSDDDVIFVVDSDLSKSSSRFKNAYKAPKHVRSPKKTIVTSVLREKPMNGASSAPSRGQTSPRRFAKSRRRSTSQLSTSLDVETIDLCSAPSTPSPVSQCESTSSHKMDQSRRQSARLATSPSHSAYSFLLGSCLANSEGLRPVQRVSNVADSSVLIDLTDEQDDDVQFLDSFKSPTPLRKEPETPKSVRVVPKFSPAQGTSSPSLFNNSFEQRIRSRPCVNNDYVDNVEKHFKTNRIAFERMKMTLNKAREKYKEANEKNIEEIIAQRLKESIKLYDEIEDEIQVEEKTVELPELTPQMIKTVEYAWDQKLNEDETLCSKLKTTIKRRDVLTLKGLQWLNDEVINGYMEMIETRGEEINIPVHAFNTFFYVSISNRGPESVRRWTRKVDIFSKDIILVPIHLQVHWCMVVVHVKLKKIYFYDSMKSTNMKVLDNVMKYLEFEHMDKKKMTLNSSQWSKECPKDIPQQMNGSDCGVFSCMFGEFSARKAPFKFSQSEMPYFRRKMTYELVTGKLIT